MDEIIALQAALAKAQLADTAHRISERNAVEIVLKIMETKRVQLLFSKSGREYVTPAHLVSEVETELIAHGGRVTIVDLAPILNMDLSHVETAARTLAQRHKGVTELAGQLLTSWYIDGVVEEINERLQESGSVALVALAQQFLLPADFMRNAIEQRLGTFVHGYIEDGQLYTQSFIQLHSARTRGIFRALVKPTPLRTLIHRYALMESRVHKDVSRMISDGSLAGTLKGVGDRAVYTPHLFLRGQQRGAEAFFESNGFIEYKKLERLAIANPKTFVETNFPAALKLQSLALSEGLVSGCVLSCEDAAASHLYTNAQSILPSVLTRAEVEQVLTHAVRTVNAGSSSSGATTAPSSSLSVMGEVWAVSDVFRSEAQTRALKQLDQWMDEEEMKAAQAAAAASAAAAAATSSAATPASKSSLAAAVAAAQSSDEEEEEEEEETTKSKSKAKSRASKKGASKSSKSVDESDAPSSKSKEKDKKRRKHADSDSDSEEPMPTKTKGKVRQPAGPTAAVLSRDRVQKWIKAGWSSIVKSAQRGHSEVHSSDAVTDESTDELIGALAASLHPACLAAQKTRLAARAAAAAAAAASAGASGLGHASEQVIRRQQLEACRLAVQDQYEQAQMYHHAIVYASGGDADAKEKSSLQRVDKSFIGHLESHLSKTIFNGLIDLLTRLEAVDALTPAQQSKLDGLENSVVLAEATDEKEKDAKPKFEVSRAPMSPRDRDVILAALPKRSGDALRSLIDVVNKEPLVFLDRFESAAKSLDLPVRKLDKKSERSRIFTMRKTLMANLAVESKPAVAMHLVVLLLFAKVHGVVVHAPARVLQTMRRVLKADMQPTAYALLRRYNQLVTRALRGDATDDTAAAAATATALASDSEDEAADERLPADAQVKSMPLEAVNAELAQRLEELRTQGMDTAIAVKAK